MTVRVCYMGRYKRQWRKAKNRRSRDSYSNRAYSRTQTVRDTGTHNLPLHHGLCYKALQTNVVTSEAEVNSSQGRKSVVQQCLLATGLLSKLNGVFPINHLAWDLLHSLRANKIGYQTSTSPQRVVQTC